MNTLLAAGVSAGSWWSVDASRLVSVRSVDGEEPVDRRVQTALRLPLPGDGRPLAMQTEHLTVVTTKDMWRLDPRVQRWRPVGYVEGDMVEKYVDAWPAVPGNGFIVLDSSRRLWSTSIAGEKSALVDAAVPGTAAILAVHGNQVLLADGSRFGWFGERWVALGMPRAATDADSGATMRVRAIASFCVEPGKDLHTGDEMDLPEKRALELIQRRRVEPAVTVA